MGHRQIGVRGLLVSSPESETRMPPIVIGKIQDQQISVMGLTNRPTQLPWTGKEKTTKNITRKEQITHLWIPNTVMLDVLLIILCCLLLLAMILRYLPTIVEPELPITTPIGKLPFFDGIILYGLIILILLVLSKVLLI